MTNFLQETDSQSWAERALSSSLSDVTSEKEGQPDAFRLCREYNLVKQARDIIPQIENTSVAEQLDRLLTIINIVIVGMAKQEEVDLSYIPPLHAHIDEDGSVLLEWAFPDFRIGFNIEQNPENSGWHLVTNKKLGDKTESGQLVDLVKIIRTVTSLSVFILSNI